MRGEWPHLSRGSSDLVRIRQSQLPGRGRDCRFEVTHEFVRVAVNLGVRRVVFLCICNDEVDLRRELPSGVRDVTSALFLALAHRRAGTSARARAQGAMTHLGKLKIGLPARATDRVTRLACARRQIDRHLYALRRSRGVSARGRSSAEREMGEGGGGGSVRAPRASWIHVRFIASVTYSK